MKKITNKPLWFYCELYKVNYYFFLGWKADEFIDYSQKHYNHKPECLGYGVCLELCHDNGCYGYAVIAHEIIHAASNALEMRGIDIRDSNRETFAYYVEYIMRRLKGLK